MRIDDIVDDIVARNASYVAALSTITYPLVTLTDAMIIAREMKDPTGNVMVLVDSQPEEATEQAPGFRIITLPVEIVVFTQRNTEDVLRNQASLYALAILNCLRVNPYFFSLVGREDFEGVEGNENLKATKLRLEFKYEEATA